MLLEILGNGHRGHRHQDGTVTSVSAIHCARTDQVCRNAPTDDEWMHIKQLSFFITQFDNNGGK